MPPGTPITGRAAAGTYHRSVVRPADIPRVDGIEELEPVGQGGFATVYRGRQPAFGRDVAVKVLQASGLNPDDQRRFERECRVMGTLSGHPGIVTLYDAGFTADGRPYLVMPYFPDGALDDRLASGPMTWQEVSVLGVQLAGALETAHRAGVVHRDIKPGNVLRSHYGSQLSDFGIARLEGGHETRSGVVTASIAHAPPEILDGGPPTETADVYSLGSTLYQALVGRSAFSRTEDESLVAMVRRVMVDPVPDLRDLGVPSAIALVVETAMAKDPADRYPTAEDLGRALQQAQATLGLNVTDLLVVGNAPPSRTTHMRPVAIPPPGSFPGGVRPPQIPEPSPTPQVSSPYQATTPLVTAVSPTAPSPGPAVSPRAQSGMRWAIPIGVGAALAATIAAFALWPRDQNDAVPTPVDSAVPSVPESAAPGTTTVGDPTTTISEATTTAPPDASVDDLTEAVLAASFDVARATDIDGFTFSDIDGIDYDQRRTLLVAVRELGPPGAADPTPATEPAVFEIPIALGDAPPSSESTLDFSSAAARPLLGPDGAPYGLDLDVEGTTLLDDGGVLVVSEGSQESGSVGGPFVHRSDAEGRFQSAFQIPDWYLADPSGTQGFIPRRGLHGITHRPGVAGQVVVAVEAPLAQDQNASEPTEPKFARLIAFDTATGQATAEWAYPLDVVSAAAVAANAGAASLVVDIAALNDESLVVLESTWSDTGVQFFSIFRVDLDEGTTPSAALPPPLEKTLITVSGVDLTDDVTPFGSIGRGPTLPDGRPSVVLATDNTSADAATRIVVLGLEPAG